MLGRGTLNRLRRDFAIGEGADTIEQPDNALLRRRRLFLIGNSLAAGSFAASGLLIGVFGGDPATYHLTAALLCFNVFLVLRDPLIPAENIPMPRPTALTNGVWDRELDDAP